MMARLWQGWSVPAEVTQSETRQGMQCRCLKRQQCQQQQMLMMMMMTTQVGEGWSLKQKPESVPHRA